MLPTPKLELDVEYLRTVLAYDPVTGRLTWRVSRGRAQRGEQAGTIGNRGYVKLMFDGRYWLAHRLAWGHVYGCLPQAPLEIDHINRIRHDNRIVNLRAVSHRENILNADFIRERIESARGTTLTRKGRWQAQIGINQRNVYLGCFDTEVEAHEAYLAAQERR